MEKAEGSFVNCENTLTILEVLWHKCIFEDEIPTEGQMMHLPFYLHLSFFYKNQDIGFTIVREMRAFEELAIKVC